MKQKVTQKAGETVPGVCACGCGRRTRIVAGKPLTYYKGTHHPNYQRNRTSCARIASEKKTLALPPPTVPVPKASAQSVNASEDRIQGMVRRMAENPEYIKAQRHWLGAVQREGSRRYVTNRRKTDVGFKLLNNLRGRIRAALKGAGKSKRTIQLIGCSIAELKLHLESQFAPGMTWSNYGNWHVDHIVPCCLFRPYSHRGTRAMLPLFQSSATLGYRQLQEERTA